MDTKYEELADKYYALLMRDNENFRRMGMDMQGEVVMNAVDYEIKNGEPFPYEGV